MHPPRLHLSSSRINQWVPCRSVKGDQKGLPLFEAVKERAMKQHEAAMHVPGHKRGRGISEPLQPYLSPSVLSLDLTEISGLDYLSYPDGPILESQTLASSLFGAQQTWFLVNGTTVGIQAAVLSTCLPGDILVLPRNCHLSCFNAMVLGDLEPIWLEPEYDPGFEVAHGVTAEAVRAAVEEGRARGGRVGAVLIVSPTYYGAISDIKSIAATCKSLGVPLIVDEAHGAHLGLHSSFPSSAVQLGADLVVQSTHKMLGSMTQSAMLHLGKAYARQQIDPAQVSKTLQMLQSSSPSYVLLCSLEGARHWAADPSNFEGPSAAVRHLLGELEKEPRVRMVHRDSPPGSTSTVVAWDPWRICLSVEGLSGYELAEKLETQHAVVPELSTQRVVALLFGPGSSSDDAERVAHAVRSICAQLPPPSASNTGASERSNASTVTSVGPLPERRLRPRSAFFSRTEAVPAAQAAGRVSAELLSPYPPGIPLVVPGEVLTGPVIQQLQRTVRAGSKVTGAADGSLETFRVIRVEIRS